MVATAPVQNIGAYGVELKDHVERVDTINIDTLERVSLNNEECRFGYRESIFKNSMKSEFLILSVVFRLDKQPSLRTEYGNIRNELDRMQADPIGIKEVREAVCNIRRSKLPDPAVLGNAGSFFKNPLISGERFRELQNEFPDISNFPQGVDYKIAAAWLIDQCGWKGKRIGDAGVHENQPLVLVNHGLANGNQIMELAIAIISSVKSKFGIELVPEVNIIG